MNEAIREAQDIHRPATCSNCGSDQGVRAFEINVNPAGYSHQVVTWCAGCARQVINGLGSAYEIAPLHWTPAQSSPDGVPLWLRMMDRLGSGDKLGKAGSEPDDNEFYEGM